MENEINYIWFDVRYRAKGYVGNDGAINIALPQATEKLAVDGVEIREVDLTKE